MRPLDRVPSIKLKLGFVIIATVAVTVLVLHFGKRAGWQIELRAAAAAALGLLMMQGLARGMTSPLREMAAAAKAMARGDHDVRVRATSRDEVGPHAAAQREAARPVVGDVHGEALRAQPRADRVGDHALVLDHADASHGEDGPTRPCKFRAPSSRCVV